MEEYPLPSEIMARDLRSHATEHCRAQKSKQTYRIFVAGSRNDYRTLPVAERFPTTLTPLMWAVDGDYEVHTNRMSNAGVITEMRRSKDWWKKQAHVCRPHFLHRDRLWQDRKKRRYQRQELTTWNRDRGWGVGQGDCYDSDLVRGEDDADLELLDSGWYHHDYCGDEEGDQAVADNDTQDGPNEAQPTQSVAPEYSRLQYGSDLATELDFFDTWQGWPLMLAGVHGTTDQETFSDYDLVSDMYDSDTESVLHEEWCDLGLDETFD